MAQLKAHPKTFAQALESLKGKDWRKIGHNTYLGRVDEDTIAVQYHQTHIVRFHRNRSVTLHTGRWYTVTTKDRLNEFISGRIYQKNHQWFYVGHKADGSLNWENPVSFVEGMEVR